MSGAPTGKACITKEPQGLSFFEKYQIGRAHV